jgi:dihydroneopterin aldolase
LLGRVATLAAPKQNVRQFGCPFKVSFMDIVYIRDLHIDTIIGIYDWEREVRQTVSIDIEMASDIRQAAATDNIEFALNYKAVSKRLITYVETRNALLVETLAEELAAIIREEFNVPWLRLRLSKPGAIRGARDVGLVIERGVKPA